MRILGTWAPRRVLALVVLAGVIAAPALGAAVWQGLKIETSIAIDVKQPLSEVVLDVEPSAFAFDPVVVKVEKAGKTKTPIEIEIKLKNNSEKDYFVYGTAILCDADGKPIASQSAKEKADDHDSARLSLKFKLPNADVQRIKTCKLKFAFEKE